MSKVSLLAGAALLTLFVATGSAQAQDAAQAKAAHPRHHVVKKTPAPDVNATLLEEVTALRGEVEQLRAAQQAQASAAAQNQAQLSAMKAQLAQAQTTAQATQTEVAEQIQTLPAEVHKQVVAVVPKTDQLHYKGVDITLGGFAALETVFRSHNEGADIGSSFAGIPLNNNVAGHTAEERFSARQSRLSLLAEGSVSPTIHLAGYGEFDFLGGAVTANSNESNSYNPRIRHLYSTVDWDQSFGGIEFLSGQTWSLLTLNAKGIIPRTEVTPLTIDAQYVPGFNWTRQPQMRVVANFDQQLWFGLSVENPQTTFFTTGKYLTGVNPTFTVPGGAEFPGAAEGYNLSLNRFPDVVGKVALDENLAGHSVHAEAYGLLRDFYERLTTAGVGGNQDTLGGGVGGATIISVLPHLLEVQASGLVGRGIGRYGSAQLPDVSFGVDGVIHPVQEYQVLLGAIGHVGSQLDLYLYGGEERQFAQNYGNSSVFNGVGNPFLNNAGCDTEGSTVCGNSTKFIDQITAGFWDRSYTGKFGRLQWGIQYSYTERHLFAGYGSANPATINYDAGPAARETMVLTSIRYYPF